MVFEMMVLLWSTDEKDGTEFLLSSVDGSMCMCYAAAGCVSITLCFSAQNMEQVLHLLLWSEDFMTQRESITFVIFLCSLSQCIIATP